MIPTYTEPYRDGELRIGWASWDKGEYKHRSIKYAYPDSSGKISRGSPELPFDILIDMLDLAGKEKELEPHLSPLLREHLNIEDMDNNQLWEERKSLNMVLLRLQVLIREVPWGQWGTAYDLIGARREEIDARLGLKKAR